MSRAKGKGKSARQKQRRRQKRAFTRNEQADKFAAAITSISKDKLTEEGLKLRHASKHCRNGMLGQMLFENIAQRMKDADTRRIERLIATGLRRGELEVTIPDAYLKDVFTDISLLTLPECDKSVLLERYPVDCTDHICTNDCDTCECVGKLGVRDENTVIDTIGGVTTGGNGTCE